MTYLAYILALVIVAIAIYLAIFLGYVAIELYNEHGLVVLVFGGVIAIAAMILVGIKE